MRKIYLISFVLGLLMQTHLVFAENTPQETANKQAVLAFYQEAINNKNYAAAEKYLGTPYTQHNPAVADDRQGLRDYINFLRQNFPQASSSIKRVFAEGEYVILHVNAIRVPETKGFAIMDIFRLDKGKIVEHWDVIQAVPETANNDNGMF